MGGYYFVGFKDTKDGFLKVISSSDPLPSYSGKLSDSVLLSSLSIKAIGDGSFNAGCPVAEI